ncbi:Receptor-like kinase [Zostera marina]|uniref:Receptor-like kinase n=1 Tax=Zostera marina TaxID=29655 RepID=A0A0K9PDM5_ZOSMR|nr:Receptor-like kinase [Zostera marina]
MCEKAKKIAVGSKIDTWYEELKTVNTRQVFSLTLSSDFSSSRWINYNTSRWRKHFTKHKRRKTESFPFPLIFSPIFFSRPPTYFRRLPFLLPPSSNQKKDLKSKKHDRKMAVGNRILTQITIIALLFFFFFAVATAAARGRARERERWDGVIITEANYEGLQAFRHGLVDPGGFLKSWNGTGIGACSGDWVGIKCVNGQVIAIQLPWKGLSGQLSEKIGQLTSLRKISIHDNFIGGRIPEAFGFLKQLRGVYLFNNRFSGEIPPEIGNSPVLQTLDISGNLLTGAIPVTLTNSTRIYRLNIGFNNLSGSIPNVLAQSSSLNFLSVNNNNLSGEIPNMWGGELGGEMLLSTVGNVGQHQLRVLNLEHNSLSGGLPLSISRLTKLEVFTVGDNKIDGRIPEELSQLTGLQQLDLSGNNLGGDFPTSLCNLSSLVLLNLDRNRIGGVFPDMIDKMDNLTVLSVNQNRFNGTIPASIGNISSLFTLDFSGNNFTGQIPDSFTKLSNLKFFNISNNQLSGPVPLTLAEKFSSSSFVGNLELCGYSSSVPCQSSSAESPPSISNAPPTISPQQISKKNPRFSTRELILIIAGCVLVFLLICCCIILCCLYQKRRLSTSSKKSPTKASAAAAGEKGGIGASGGGGPDIESGGEAGGKLVHFDGPMVFTADDLLCATAEIMGKSTYGTVYKATLEGGHHVAVKRLREKIAKGQKEFESEVNLIGKIRHPNLLALRAYYLGPKGEKLLVFDYMPKGSLAAFLHARGPETPIDWPTRMKIAIGTARGLLQLQTTNNMIHGNMTSSNILLDDDSTPKIADFGLSRLMTASASSNVIATAGALGYRAPELSKLKKANSKTDVYSLGIVLLELLTGKSPGEAMNGVDLPQWVASIVKEEWTSEVFDLELIRDADTGDELVDTLKLALHCVDPSPTARPEVQQILQQLEEIKPELAATSSGGNDAVDDVKLPEKEGGGN